MENHFLNEIEDQGFLDEHFDLKGKQLMPYLAACPMKYRNKPGSIGPLVAKKTLKKTPEGSFWIGFTSSCYHVAVTGDNSRKLPYFDLYQCRGIPGHSEEPENLSAPIHGETDQRLRLNTTERCWGNPVTIFSNKVLFSHRINDKFYENGIHFKTGPGTPDNQLLTDFVIIYSKNSIPIFHFLPIYTKIGPLIGTNPIKLSSLRSSPEFTNPVEYFQKTGATSGYTKLKLGDNGTYEVKILANQSAESEIHNRKIKAYYSGLVAIEAKAKKGHKLPKKARFSGGGDSGSPVFDQNNLLIGIVTAGDDSASIHTTYIQLWEPIRASYKGNIQLVYGIKCLSSLYIPKTDKNGNKVFETRVFRWSKYDPGSGSFSLCFGQNFINNKVETILVGRAILPLEDEISRYQLDKASAATSSSGNNYVAGIIYKSAEKLLKLFKYNQTHFLTQLTKDDFVNGRMPEVNDYSDVRMVKGVNGNIQLLTLMKNGEILSWYQPESSTKFRYTEKYFTTKIFTNQTFDFIDVCVWDKMDSTPDQTVVIGVKRNEETPDILNISYTMLAENKKDWLKAKDQPIRLPGKVEHVALVNSPKDKAIFLVLNVLAPQEEDGLPYRHIYTFKSGSWSQLSGYKPKKEDIVFQEMKGITIINPDHPDKSGPYLMVLEKTTCKHSTLPLIPDQLP